MRYTQKNTQELLLKLGDYPRPRQRLYVGGPAKKGGQAGAIQSAQKDMTLTAEEIQAGIQESTRQIRAIAKFVAWSGWIYPRATAVLVSLLWTGFVHWRMPDYDTIIQYQSAIYELIKEQGKNLGQAAGRK